MQIPVPACIDCTNFNREMWNCPAFPNGISDEIKFGDKHENPIFGQVGDTVFKQAFYINDNHQYLRIFNSCCTYCEHFDFLNIACPAYLDEIPIPILQGKMKHDKLMFRQRNNIVFEPIQNTHT